MSNPVPDTQPDTDEVLQHEPEELNIVPVPVAVEGPVNVRTLPSPIWATARAAPTDSTGSLQLLGANPQRRRAVIIASVAGCYIAPTRGQVDSRSGAFIPASVPIVIEHVGEVWVNNVATESPSVSAIIEHWTG